MNLVLHTWKDHTISQRLDGFVCLTDMANSENTDIVQYFRNQNVKDYIEALSEQYPLTELVVTEGSGRFSKTWVHPEIAIDFAQWVSIPFRIWANKKIREIITDGYSLSENITLDQLETLEGQVKELKKELKSLQSDNKFLNNQLDHYVVGRKLSADEEVKQFHLRMKYLESVSPKDYRSHAIAYARFVSELESPGFLYRRFPDLTEKEYKEDMKNYVKQFRHIILKDANLKKLVDVFRCQYPKVL